MHEHVCIATNRRGKVRVLGHGEAIMADLGNVDRAHAKVNGLVHGSGRQDSHQLVEERIVLSLGQIERLSELL